MSVYFVINLRVYGGMRVYIMLNTKEKFLNDFRNTQQLNNSEFLNDFQMQTHFNFTQSSKNS